MNGLAVLLIASVSFIGSFLSLTLSFQYGSWLPFLGWMSLWIVPAVIADRDAKRRMKIRYKIREVKQ